MHIIGLDRKQVWNRRTELFLYCACYITGVANQSETMSHISYCVTAKNHITHMGTY